MVLSYAFFAAEDASNLNGKNYLIPVKKMLERLPSGVIEWALIRFLRFGFQRRYLRIQVSRHFGYFCILVGYAVEKGIIHLQMLLQNMEVRPDLRWRSVVKDKLLNCVKVLCKFHSEMRMRANLWIEQKIF